MRTGDVIHPAERGLEWLHILRAHWARSYATPLHSTAGAAPYNPKSQIPNPKSQIPNPKSQIPNPKSQIPNPKS